MWSLTMAFLLIFWYSRGGQVRLCRSSTLMLCWMISSTTHRNTWTHLQKQPGSIIPVARSILQTVSTLLIPSALSCGMMSCIRRRKHVSLYCSLVKYRACHNVEESADNTQTHISQRNSSTSWLEIPHMERVLARQKKRTRIGYQEQNKVKLGS